MTMFRPPSDSLAKSARGRDFNRFVTLMAHGRHKRAVPMETAVHRLRDDDPGSRG
jgi:hypothetical protein